MTKIVESSDNMDNLIESNSHFAFEKMRKNKDYFKSIENTQDPKVLWIGCSDSRTSPEILTNCDDPNSKSAIQYAVEHLKIYDIMVVGHTGCGAIKAALDYKHVEGDVATWIKPIYNTYKRYSKEINSLKTDEEKVNELSKLNVKRVVSVINHLDFFKESAKKGKHINVNGYLLDLHNGQLKNLHLNKTNFHDGL
ncbi:hypothetical protein BB561_000346 [Smittium simulii]|uniref:Carbonic anhydrase n=1 Tax=Smittium simulii TaxID=133385 RepID=A0A2T9YZD6_9FUNG|nr:hypothetical protein BB561_000346 [Smittium simulii]